MSREIKYRVNKGGLNMNKIEELRNYLLENYVDEYGNLDISYLDFSDFEGNVYINDMKVKGYLSQSRHEVKGSLRDVRNRYGVNLYETPPTKLLKEITEGELAKLGYALKGEN